MGITALGSILASSGFWAYIQSKDKRNDMLKGLGHDRITYLCSSYIKRGYMTTDDYENLYDYLYKPYKKMGGNGSAERLMREVDKLPIQNN